MPLPTGTVTFLFTDIEGSTKLWELYPETMPAALDRHDTLLRQCIEASNGYVFKTVGDAFCAAFAVASDALKAAVQSQVLLSHEPWPSPLQITVRMALHTGAAQERDGDYFGQTLNRVARLLSTGYGQQTLLSQTTSDLVCGGLPPEMILRDLGQHRLKDLQQPEQVYQLDHPLLPGEFPPLKSLDNPALLNNLPQQVTSFIGREVESETVKTLLAKTRLLTLTGSGGCGKTRLSLQVAADVLEDYPDGVWLVELAPLADPALVPQAVASVRGVQEEAGKTILQTLTESLKAKKLLLILDNCEHMLDACARLADALLKTCPQVRLLASSREGLGISGELTYHVPSLSLPDPKQRQTSESLMQYEAARLFIERALFHHSGFLVTEANAPPLAELCVRLDGIPLALELAAARIRALSVEEINGRLDNRFRLLTGGSRTALPRQQTLRALIDWSYDLLTESEKELLQALSVFAGGWTSEAAEAVGSGGAVEDWEALDLLTSLCDKSLVVAEPQEDQTRYRLLETVRQYARDRLVESGRSEAVRTRHQAFYLALGEAAGLLLSGPEQARWFDQLEREHDNLRAALEWSADGDAEAALRIAGAVWVFWDVRGYFSEGRERLAAVLARADAQGRHPARARALHGAGQLARLQGDYPAAGILLTESLAIFRELGDNASSASSLQGLGYGTLMTGDIAEARLLLEESLTLYRALGRKGGIANSLSYLGHVAFIGGDLTAARALYEEGLALNREVGSKLDLASPLCNLGNVAYLQGDLDTARALYEESLALNQELGSKKDIAGLLANLGCVAYEQGDFAGARRLNEQSLALNQEMGNNLDIANALHSLGNVAFMEGDPTAAGTLYGESLALRRTSDYHPSIAESLCGLGNVASEQGRFAEARLLYEESLAIRRAFVNKPGIASLLEGFAALSARQQIPTRAALLWGAAQALRETTGAPLPPSERPRYNRQVAQARASSNEEAFAAAWAAGRALPLEKAMEYALGTSAESSGSGSFGGG